MQKLCSYNIILPKYFGFVNMKGSTLTFSAQGGRGKEKYVAAAKISVRPRKNTAEGGCGGEFRRVLAKNRGQPRRLHR